MMSTFCPDCGHAANLHGAQYRDGKFCAFPECCCGRLFAQAQPSTPLSELNPTPLDSHDVAEFEPIYLKSEVDKIIASLRKDLAYYKTVADTFEQNAPVAVQGLQKRLVEATENSRMLTGRLEDLTVKLTEAERQLEHCKAHWDALVREPVDGE